MKKRTEDSKKQNRILHRYEVRPRADKLTKERAWFTCELRAHEYSKSLQDRSGRVFDVIDLHMSGT